MKEQSDQGNTPLVTTLETAKGWWAKVPVITRMLIFSSIAIYLISLLIPFNFYMENIPIYTIHHFQFWRIFTAPIANMTFISLFFGLLVYVPPAADREREKGSVLFALDFFYVNLQIQIVFTVFCFLIGLIFPSLLSLQSSNLWPLFMASLVKTCLQAPDQRIPILCLPIVIRARFYPIGLYIFFCIFSGRILLDVLAAVLVGYLHYENLWPQIEVSKERLLAIEQSFLCRWLTTRASFWRVEDSVNFGNAVARGQNLVGSTNFGGKGMEVGRSDDPFRAHGPNDIEVAQAASIEKDIPVMGGGDSLYRSEGKTDSDRFIVEDEDLGGENSDRKDQAAARKKRGRKYQAFSQEENSNAEQFSP
eukprot:TRINITY_DN8663_c0_g1_i4.p1 TRINITY_DN8663_c0_g1~~TRINITY_DN8663_c0_g1_i4.p1  ORF type:complete len:363 (+),score=87.80 TRINITY_DN8663_c0_g1_i4:83-1171(+)